MTPDGVVVATALAVVLVSVSGIAIATTLRVAVVVCVLDALGDLLHPVVGREQTIKWAAGVFEREGKTMMASGRRWMYPCIEEPTIQIQGTTCKVAIFFDLFVLLRRPSTIEPLCIER